ncbi:MAG: hypothetical protein AAF637_20815, partial [Pseudomonadota bacterium]
RSGNRLRSLEASILILPSEPSHLQQALTHRFRAALKSLRISRLLGLFGREDIGLHIDIEP